MFRLAPSKLLCVAVLSIPLLTMAINNDTLVMTFEGSPRRNLATQDYMENGIKMSLVANHYDIVLDATNTYLNADTYHANATASIKFELVDGGLFRLDSVAVLFREVVWSNPGSEPPPGFRSLADYDFAFSDGSMLLPVPQPANQWFVLDDFFSELPPLTYFIYSIRVPEPVNIVSWQYNSHLDNITLTPVPEPSALGLVGFGLVGMLIRQRRMKRV